MTLRKNTQSNHYQQNTLVLSNFITDKIFVVLNNMLFLMRKKIKDFQQVYILKATFYVAMWFNFSNHIAT